MSQQAVEEALGRLITDSEFRRVFHMDPTATCQRESLDLTTCEIEALVALNTSSLQAVARLLDPRIVRATMGGAYHSRWARSSHDAPARGRRS